MPDTVGGIDSLVEVIEAGTDEVVLDEVVLDAEVEFDIAMGTID